MFTREKLDQELAIAIDRAKSASAEEINLARFYDQGFSSLAPAVLIECGIKSEDAILFMDEFHRYLKSPNGLYDSIHTVKNSLKLPRPIEYAKQKGLVFPSDFETGFKSEYSHPSGHSAVSMFFALISVTSFYQRSEPKSLLEVIELAKKIARSRVIIGAHYDVDLLAGRELAKDLFLSRIEHLYSSEEQRLFGKRLAALVSLDPYSEESIPLKVLLSSNAIAKKAQAIYNDWQQDEEGFDDCYGSGGICDEIADAIVNVLTTVDVNCYTENYADRGFNHTSVTAIDYTRREAFEVDIPYTVYEIGSGYNFEKIIDVLIKPEDVYINELDFELVTEVNDQY